jgi:hypothetical protein
MAGAAVPNLLQLAWNAVWAQIQLDIANNPGNWLVTRRNFTLRRNPPLALGVPFRIVVQRVNGAVPPAPPAADNNGTQVLAATIPAAALAGVWHQAGPAQPNWNDIDNNVVP